MYILQSFCAALYIIISVRLTDNDSVDSFRIYYFMLLAIMATLSAQAWGFFVGATLPTKVQYKHINKFRTLTNVTYYFL